MKPEPLPTSTSPRPFKRLVPAPLLSLALLGLWLLLNRSLSAGHFVLGSVLALAIPLLTAGLRPLPVRMRKPGTVLQGRHTDPATVTRIGDMLRSGQPFYEEILNSDAETYNGSNVGNMTEFSKLAVIACSDNDRVIGSRKDLIRHDIWVSVTKSDRILFGIEITRARIDEP